MYHSYATINYFEEFQTALKKENISVNDQVKVFENIIIFQQTRLSQYH
jgi:hypothetical protein